MTSPEISSNHCTADIVIFGGGIAGLWLLNHLSAQGYSGLLLESSTLGNGQSIASQGIIHGGLKYALSGTLSEAARAIAAMPARWKACLAGDDPVDLSGCRLLSDCYYMWSEGSYRSRLKAFLGSRNLRGKVEALAEQNYPAPLEQARGQGSLYQLPDFVVDTSSLLETLASRYRDRIFRIDSEQLEFSTADDQTRVVVKSGDALVTIRSQRIVFAAGEGNAKLIEQAGLSSPEMQRRPLNMVMVRAPSLPRLYVHCIGDSFSLTPKLTLTSHPCRNGEVAWYLGGELAESGVGRSDADQVREAEHLLNTLFPWVNLNAARWACLPINRAEGRDPGRHRPDSVFVSAREPYLVTWPTKFTLSPALADEVCDQLTRQKIVPELELSIAPLTAHLHQPAVALPPWETSFDRS